MKWDFGGEGDANADYLWIKLVKMNVKERQEVSNLTGSRLKKGVANLSGIIVNE
jgi:hypothetical protein